MTTAGRWNGTRSGWQSGAVARDRSCPLLVRATVPILLPPCYPLSSPPSMSTKSDRQNAIRDLVESRVVGSQEELRKLLRQRGWDVTQSTLSRDLREMRLARVPTDEGARYVMTGSEPDTGRMSLETLLPQLFDRIDGTGELLVLHTLPGGAQALGFAIDAEQWPDLLGTIAGDDTILLICRSAQAREKVGRRIRALAGEA